METPGKLTKEEQKRQKQEESDKKDKEVSDKLSEVNKLTSELRFNKTTLKENFLITVRNSLSLWNLKVKNEKLADDIYLSTAKLIEYALTEKDLNNFSDNLSEEDKCNLVKFFYKTYERVSKKLNCLTLKPNKIYQIHQNILSKEGVGIVSRALFAIQK